MSEKKMHRKMVTSRKSIIGILLYLVFISVIFTVIVMITLRPLHLELNVSLCTLGAMILLILLWLPMFVPDQQLWDINEQAVSVVPKLSTKMKWKFIGGILCNDTVAPYVIILSYQEIKELKFHIERHAGYMGYSRYTFLLDIQTKDEIIKLVMNPMDNGVWIPSSRGGNIFFGFHSKTDILNMMKFMETNEVKIQDPYHIIEAMKNPDLILYDYLESLSIRVKY